jgi:hypothetical protein
MDGKNQSYIRPGIGFNGPLKKPPLTGKWHRRWPRLSRAFFPDFFQKKAMIT